MKHFSFDNRWDAIKGQLKQQYGQLTDDDLTFAEGKGEELLARLREKLSLSENDLDALLNELHTSVGGRMDQAKMKAAEIADEARTRATQVAGEVKSRAAAVGEQARAQAGVAYDQALQRARSFREDGEEYVRKNPRESLLAAVCAGFVAGLLLRH